MPHLRSGLIGFGGTGGSGGRDTIETVEVDNFPCYAALARDVKPISSRRPADSRGRSNYYRYRNRWRATEQRTYGRMAWQGGGMAYRPVGPCAGLNLSENDPPEVCVGFCAPKRFLWSGRLALIAVQILVPESDGMRVLSEHLPLFPFVVLAVVIFLFFTGVLLPPACPQSTLLLARHAVVSVRIQGRRGCTGVHPC